jgi:quercetin dioxygenase-like cupin family protein
MFAHKQITTVRQRRRTALSHSVILGRNDMAQQLERKSLDKPDETRPFKDAKGKLDVVTVGSHTFGRGVFQPGWRWSQHVKPIAGTPSCQASHTGYVLEGRMVVKMDDGAEVEYGPGDAFYMPPGHDAWIVGDKPCVMIDFTGVAKYAKPA